MAYPMITSKRYAGYLHRVIPLPGRGCNRPDSNKLWLV